MPFVYFWVFGYRGVPHLKENAPPTDPAVRPMSRVLGGPRGVSVFLMGEVPR